MFPFLSGHGERKYPRPVWFGFVFLVGRTFLAYESSSFLCHLYDFPTAEPQKYVCYLVFYGNMVVTFHRILVFKRTTELWGKIEQLNFPKRGFSLGSIFACILIFLEATKLIAFSHSDNLPNWMKLYLAMNYVSIWGPFLVESQFIMVCYSVHSGLTKVGAHLDNSKLNIDLLEALKKSFKFQRGIFKAALKCYGFDAFLSMSLSLLYSCVTLNDFINITLQYTGSLVIYENLPPWTLQIYLLKVIYFLFNLVRENMFLIWFAGVASDLQVEVKSISRRLYRVDQNKIDDQVKKEVVLLLEQISATKLDVDACGFFIVGARFVFKDPLAFEK
ncbi:hypothetical protein J6590_017693 [Homalodisca vitripennis]|nr:hypothetical protein J6590_017693 [Homalodisca vitripennis]